MIPNTPYSALLILSMLELLAKSLMRASNGVTNKIFKQCLLITSPLAHHEIILCNDAGNEVALEGKDFCIPNYGNLFRDNFIVLSVYSFAFCLLTLIALVRSALYTLSPGSINIVLSMCILVLNRVVPT